MILIATPGTDDLECFPVVDGNVISQGISECDVMTAIEPEFQPN
jgi:hypothetical protein